MERVVDIHLERFLRRSLRRANKKGRLRFHKLHSIPEGIHVGPSIRREIELVIIQILSFLHGESIQELGWSYQLRMFLIQVNSSSLRSTFYQDGTWGFDYDLEA